VRGIPDRVDSPPPQSRRDGAGTWSARSHSSRSPRHRWIAPDRTTPTNSTAAEARQHITSGELGDLYSIRLVSHNRQPPPERCLTGKGSIYLDLHVHDFDLARWLTEDNVADIVTVAADRTPYDYLAESGDADTTSIVLRMRNGVMVTITGARHSPAGHDVRARSSAPARPSPSASTVASR
jgi:hypothetical protein